MHDLKQAIKEASYIVIALSPDASDKDYLAALQIHGIAPQKTFISSPDEKESAWQGALGIAPQQKEFAIVVDTNISPVDELRYEKSENKLSIFLSHKSTFDRRAIKFEESIPPADLFVTIGFGSQESAESHIESFAKIGYSRHIRIEDKAQEKLSLSSAGLLGRILARSREETEISVLWSFVTREDFTKTQAKPEAIPDLMRILRNIAPLPEITVILWQSPDGDKTDGIVWCQKKRFLLSASSDLGAVISGSDYVQLPQYSNFIEAETEVRKLLMRIP